MLNENVDVEIRNGKIFIDGHDQGLERDDHQHMRLTVRDIRKSHTVAMLDQTKLEDRRLHGSGDLEGTLGLAGQTHSVKSVDVIIQAAPADRADLDWHTFIGASFADGELSDEDAWTVQVRVPGDVWRRLEFDYDADQAREIELNVEAPLWCKPVPFFHQRRPDLKLTPDRNGGGGATHGRTTGITWLDRAPANGPIQEHTANDDFAPAVPAQVPLPLSSSVITTVTWTLPVIVILLAYIAARA